MYTERQISNIFERLLLNQVDNIKYTREAIIPFADSLVKAENAKKLSDKEYKDSISSAVLISYMLGVYTRKNEDGDAVNPSEINELSRMVSTILSDL
jgi:hypothetical protein